MPLLDLGLITVHHSFPHAHTWGISQARFQNYKPTTSCMTGIPPSTAHPDETRQGQSSSKCSWRKARLVIYRDGDGENSPKSKWSWCIPKLNLHQSGFFFHPVVTWWQSHLLQHKYLEYEFDWQRVLSQSNNVDPSPIQKLKWKDIATKPPRHPIEKNSLMVNYRWVEEYTNT